MSAAMASSTAAVGGIPTRRSCIRFACSRGPAPALVAVRARAVATTIPRRSIDRPHSPGPRASSRDRDQDHRPRRRADPYQGSRPAIPAAGRADPGGAADRLRTACAGSAARSGTFVTFPALRAADPGVAMWRALLSLCVALLVWDAAAADLPGAEVAGAIDEGEARVRARLLVHPDD